MTVVVWTINVASTLTPFPSKSSQSGGSRGASCLFTSFDRTGFANLGLIKRSLLVEFTHRLPLPR